MLVFLWTDIFLWLLVLVAILSIYMLRKKPDFIKAYKLMSSSPTAVISSIVLVLYLIIGLLDSIHYREHIPIITNAAKVDDKKFDHNHTSTEAITHYGDEASVLDYLLQPWSKLTEKTFAAPFSDKLFVKERIVSETGDIKVVYPKVEHASGHDIYLLYLNLAVTVFIVVILLLGIICLINKILKKSYNKELNGSRLGYYSFIATLCISALFIALLYVLYQCFHVLGTDKIGQDILYVSIKSIRTGLVIGSLTSIFMLPLALLFGTCAGYFGGRVDDLIQYIYTTLSSIPGVLLISAFILIIQTQIMLHPDWFETLSEQADIRLLALCMILGLTSWSGLCRLIRAETLKIRELDYVTAAKTMRVGHFKIIIRHIIPNLTHIVIINVAISFSGLILAEAVLSYIGVGVDPTTMSWGNMINSARLELSREPVIWWPILGAFLPMFIFVLALNLFADKLRDAFDPRIRVN